MKGKVLVVGHIMKTHGGGSRFQEDLLNSQIHYNFVHFNTARPPKLRSVLGTVPDYGELFSSGLRRTAIAIIITGWHLLKFPWILIREAPVIVHIAAVTYWPFWESAIYLLISKIMGAKVVFHMLAPFDVFYQKSSTKMQSLIQTALRPADRVVCLSRRDKALMSTFLPSSSVCVLRSNVRVSFGSTANVDRRGRERINVLFVAGLYPFRKGIYDILKALPIVIGACKNVCFTFTGGDNVQHALDHSLDSCFTPWVSFRGWIAEAEKVALYHAADLLLLPSYEEGLPYVIIEAMAAGLPIISTHVGAIPEVIKEGTNGFLINPGDYEALAGRIVRLCRDEELRLQIGHANHDKATRLYAQDVIFQELEAIYDQLVNNQQRGKVTGLIPSDSKND